MEKSNTSIDEEILESPFDSIPNEVLEFILGFLPPYRDLETCMSVCKRWNSCARSKIKLNIVYVLNIFIYTVLFQMSFVRLNCVSIKQSKKSI